MNEKVINDVLRKLDYLSIASCSCLTKTPDIEFHSDTCRYKILQEIKKQILQLS